MLQSVVLAINLKMQQEKTTLQVFFISYTMPASPLGIYGILLQLLMLLTITAKKKTLFAGIHFYLHGIAGFTEQQTAFTHTQSTFLQSQDFYLHV